MRKLKLVLVVFMVLAVFSACQGRRRSAGEPGREMAMILKTLNNPFFISMMEGAQEEARLHGYELLVQAPEREYDVERQMQIVESMIARNVAAILLTPSGSIEIVPAIKLANEANIPVMNIDEKIDPAALAADGAFVDTYIASDNYLGGEMAARLMIELLNNEGRVAILEGVAGHEVTLARTGGFADYIRANSNIQIVASQPANWEREQGFNVFQNILTANPDITGLFAASDLMALGATEAIEQAGLRGRIMVIGFDANDEAKQAVSDGIMMGTIAQDPVLMGRLAVQNAVRVLNGETISMEIPVDIVVVTRDTL